MDLFAAVAQWADAGGTYLREGELRRVLPHQGRLWLITDVHHGKLKLSATPLVPDEGGPVTHQGGGYRLDADATIRLQFLLPPHNPSSKEEVEQLFLAQHAKGQLPLPLTSMLEYGSNYRILSIGEYAFLYTGAGVYWLPVEGVFTPVNEINVDSLRRRAEDEGKNVESTDWLQLEAAPVPAPAHESTPSMRSDPPDAAPGMKPSPAQQPAAPEETKATTESTAQEQQTGDDNNGAPDGSDGLPVPPPQAREYLSVDGTLITQDDSGFHAPLDKVESILQVGRGPSTGNYLLDAINTYLVMPGGKPYRVTRLDNDHENGFVARLLPQSAELEDARDADWIPLHFDRLPLSPLTTNAVEDWVRANLDGLFSDSEREKVRQDSGFMTGYFGSKKDGELAFIVPPAYADQVHASADGRVTDIPYLVPDIQSGQVTSYSYAFLARVTGQEMPVYHGARMEPSAPRGAPVAQKASPETQLNPDHFFIGDEIDREGNSFSPKERLEDNMAAMRTLQDLRDNQKIPTPEDKRTLAKYVSWGAFKEVAQGISYRLNEREKEVADYLTGSLSEQEREAVADTLLNAHYTSRSVIESMWDLVVAAGHKKGRMLEPAAGVGNFLGLAPQAVVDQTRFFAVEKDPIAGSILRNLYPDTKIDVCGFEDKRYPKDFFDLVMTNVPFGKYKIHDPEYNRLNLSIHNYFLLRSLDMLKPGAMMAVLTSRYTLDAKGLDRARKAMWERADLVGALRLPMNAQRAQAGTDVVTDLLFFRKRCRQLSAEERANAADVDWLNTDEIVVYGDNDRQCTLERNRYYTQNPTHRLGAERAISDRFGTGYTVTLPHADDDVPVAEKTASQIRSHIDELSSRFSALAESDKPTVTKVPAQDDIDHAETQEISEHPENYLYPLGSMVVLDDGDIGIIDGYTYEEKDDDDQSLADRDRPPIPNTYQVERTGIRGKKKERLTALCHLRDIAIDLVALQTTWDNDEDEVARQRYETLQAKLNAEYDEFVEKYGLVSQRTNHIDFLDDPQVGRVLSLEKEYNPKTETAAKADLFSKRVIYPPRPQEPESVEDAYMQCLAEYGRIVPSVIEEMAEGLVPDEHESAISYLLHKELVFLDPQSLNYEPSFLYLSGNVVEKLEAAQEAGEAFNDNIRALEAVQPEPLTADQVQVRPGMTWITPEEVTEFARELFDTKHMGDNAGEMVYSEATGLWSARVASGVKSSTKCRMDYGTPRRNAWNLLESICNSKPIEVKDTVENADGSRKSVLNLEETLKAQDKATLIQEEFRHWLFFKDSERGEKLLARYNRLKNATVDTQWNGSHLTFPGKNPDIELRSSQVNAVWRYILDGRVVLAHEVGVGKTFTMIAASMEAKRMGLQNKTFIVVKNNTLMQFDAAIRTLYPNAKVTTVNKLKTGSKKERQRFHATIAYNDWDIVLVPHSVFERIPAPREFVEASIREEVSNAMAAMTDAESSDAPRFEISRYRTKVKQLEARLKRLAADEKKDEGFNVKTLGMDALFIDEVHNYKSLTDKVSSQRALDMRIKADWLRDNRGDHKGVLTASGTIISNELGEIHVQSRLAQPDVLVRQGEYSYSAWVSNNVHTVNVFEPAPGGDGFKMRGRERLINAPETMAAFREHVDVVFADDVGIPRPELENIKHVAEMTPLQDSLRDNLVKRAKTPSKEDNILKIMGDGIRMSLYPPLMTGADAPPSLHNIDDSKIGLMMDEVIGAYEAHAEMRGSQLVFCDLGVPGGSSEYNIHQLIKEHLMMRGIPEGEIAFVHDAKNDRAKSELFARVNAGEVRVLLGTTERMGEGTNVQERLSDIHVLVPPWKPSLIEQIRGRGHRFGNLHDRVKMHLYSTKGSLDTFMYSTLHNKAVAFGALLRGDKSLREYGMEADMTYAEVLAATTDNPLIKDKMETEHALTEMQARRRGFERTVMQARSEMAFYKDILQETREKSEQTMRIPKVNWGERDTAENGWVVEINGHPHRLVKKKLVNLGEQQELIEGEPLSPQMPRQELYGIVKLFGTGVIESITCHGAKVTIDPTRVASWVLHDEQGNPITGYQNGADIEHALWSRDNKVAALADQEQAASEKIEQCRPHTEGRWNGEKEYAELQKKCRIIDQLIEKGITDPNALEQALLTGKVPPANATAMPMAQSA
uniref:DEAD/DEAH box helicase family protein n=1 Tax=Thiolapillus sp. TaxID=2017437 RepID=UPI003AF62B0B